LDGSPESLHECWNVLDQYYLLSGLKTNETKSKAIWIGKNKYSPYTVKTRKKISWVTDGLFSCLGIDFSLNLADMVTINYARIYAKIKKQMQLWSNRKISVLGRITVVKSLLLPQFNHLIMSIPDPSNGSERFLQIYLENK